MLKRFIAIFVTLSLVLAGFLVLIYAFESKSVRVSLEAKETAHLEILSNTISGHFKNVTSDLAVLSGLRELTDKIGVIKKDPQSELGRQFISFMKMKRIYDQIRLLDERGFEVIRVTTIGASRLRRRLRDSSLKETAITLKKP